MAATFQAVQCWKDERVSQVINKEAVSVDVIDFLATHTPINRIRQGIFDEENRQIQNGNDLSEDELLKDMMTYVNNNRHIFMVVQGIPGAGKSHLIRWLKERYEVENKRNGEPDVVVLIERAQCNLRDTLRQILAKNIFPEKEMHQQLEKLKFASNELSRAALADNIIDQLRIATSEVELDQHERPKVFIRKRIDKFLLDSDIRDELKKPGGPIDRLVRFLSVGSKGNVSRDKIPEFLPDDFLFNQDLLWKLREEGKREAVELLEKLLGIDGIEEGEETRVMLARFLSHNKLLNYAVGRIASITADDLKQMFYDLRRFLHRQGRNLALFIEDIAAFTGVDIGLIDVLVTQHSGESNREFCRMLSVVGITEDYYFERLPDNIKTRATHTLSLDVVRNQDGRNASDMLNDPESVSLMSARYLNALRLDVAQLTDWQRSGAQPEDLPNACVLLCPHRETCHAAFGSVNIAPAGQEEQPIGLYPFNKNALSTMFERTTTIARTPRTLLGSVIGHVLDKHGSKVRARQFPPEENLGSEFETPSLSQLLLQSIRSQVGENLAERVGNLLRFWAKPVNGNERQPLPLEVFKAFSLPPVKLEQVDVPVEKPSVNPGPTGPKPVPDDRIALYKNDIDRWARDPEYKLQQYEKLTETLYSIIYNFIDWESYSITPVILGDRFGSRSRLYIENQVAKSSLGEYITFMRTQELAIVLEAVADIGISAAPYGDWRRGQFGGHMVNLRAWLRKIEPEIIEFILQPKKGIVPSGTLPEITLYNCLSEDLLLGQLGPENSTPPGLLRGLYKSWGKVAELETKSASQLNQARQFESRSELWKDLLVGLDAEKLKKSRQTCLSLFNLAQGSSQDVRFLNAAAILDILQNFEQKDWQCEPISPDPLESGVAAWQDGVKLYGNFQTHLLQAFSKELVQAQLTASNLKKLIGNSKPEEVFKSIEDTLDAFKAYSWGHPFQKQDQFNSIGLKTVLAWLDYLLQEEHLTLQLLHLSSGAKTLRQAQNYLDYLGRFNNECILQQQKLKDRLNEIRLNNSGNLFEVVNRTYSELGQELELLPYLVSNQEIKS